MCMYTLVYILNDIFNTFKFLVQHHDRFYIYLTVGIKLFSNLKIQLKKKLLDNHAKNYKTNGNITYYTIIVVIGNIIYLLVFFFKFFCFFFAHTLTHCERITSKCKYDIQIFPRIIGFN